MTDLDAFNVDHLRIDKLIRDKKWAEAVTQAEAAALRYPSQKYDLLATKLRALAANPATQEEAVRYATELALTLSADPVLYNKRQHFWTLTNAILRSTEGRLDPRLAGITLVLSEHVVSGRFGGVSKLSEAERAWQAVSDKNLLGTVSLKADRRCLPPGSSARHSLSSRPCHGGPSIRNRRRRTAKCWNDMRLGSRPNWRRRRMTSNGRSNDERANAPPLAVKTLAGGCASR